MDKLLSDLTTRALLTAEQAERVRSLAADGRDTAVRLLIRQGVMDQQVLAAELSRFFALPLAATWPDARANRKSPTRIAIVLPYRRLALVTPRRMSASSITSSW